MHRHIDSLISALALVRLGQDLAADTPAARAVASLIDALLSLVGLFR